MGGDDNLIERMLRRREWQVVHPGVYVDHTGRPSDEQMRMAAVLFAWPAALAGDSALIAHGVRNIPGETVTVAIDTRRRIKARPGMLVLRITRLKDLTVSTLVPARLRLEPAVLLLASARWRTGGEGAAVALLSDVCQQRRTTPARLAAQLDDLACLPGRSFLRAVLQDVGAARFRCSSTAISAASSGPMGFREANGSSGSGTASGPVSATSTTRISGV